MVLNSKMRGLLFASVAALPMACASNSGDNTDSSSDEAALSTIVQHPFKSVCAETTAKVRCHAKVQVDNDGVVRPTAAPQGLGPKDLASAYKIPSKATGKATIAIVDANDDPTAEADLAVYRQTFGLPPCTTANGCFKKVNQRGQTSPLPPVDTGWASEIALDIEMASAVCPSCNILLVEADSADWDPLGASVAMAAQLGATVVSNSYGGGEDATVIANDAKYFKHPGVAVFASSGDSGFGVSYPASSQFVIGVGGTSLAKSSSTRGWAEQTWNGAGSGCSTLVPKPSYQNDKGCTFKIVADLSAVADPATGVAVYDTTGVAGWSVFGGTSVSSPLVASIFAATGNGKKDGSFVWKHHGNFNDVTSGNNGTCSPHHYFCTAGKGYDGPTGWGTPKSSQLVGLTDEE